MVDASVYFRQMPVYISGKKYTDRYIFISGKKYTVIDVCAVISMVIGLICFTLADNRVSPSFNTYGNLLFYIYPKIGTPQLLTIFLLNLEKFNPLYTE